MVVVVVVVEREGFCSRGRGGSRRGVGVCSLLGLTLTHNLRNSIPSEGRRRSHAKLDAPEAETGVQTSGGDGGS